MVGAFVVSGPSFSMPNQQKPTIQPQPMEPSLEWVEFYAHALRLQAVARQRRAAKEQFASGETESVSPKVPTKLD
jgi:hypothetical protein